MPDKKLTDNEIIKALTICTTKGAKCTDCPAFVKVDRSNCKKVLLGAIDLINRLQAENERLEHQLETLCITLKLAKAEAYKEFAELLCEDRVSNDPVVIAAKCLLKELVGEDK